MEKNEVKNAKSEFHVNWTQVEEWIRIASLIELLKKSNKFVKINLHLRKKLKKNNELRNYVLFCQHVKSSLLMKYVILTNDINLIFHVIAQIVVMFYDSREFNYQIETLFMFWTTCRDAYFKNLQTTILINLLTNFRNRKDKFISMSLHFEILNDEVKKVMRDRQISSINMFCLFEYSFRYAIIVRE